MNPEQRQLSEVIKFAISVFYSQDTSNMETECSEMYTLQQYPGKAHSGESEHNCPEVSNH